MPPLVIAHRGASATAPESTAAAIRAAVRAGAAMVELDVQMTRDRRLVIFHDDRLERTTDGTGHLTQATWAQLARLDAGGWFHRRCKGERILLVSQALALLPPSVGVNLELKTTARPRALLCRVVRVLRRARGTKRIWLSSFHAALLRPLRRTGWPLALICREEADRALARAIRLGCAAWHPFHTLLTPRRLARAHAAGLRVHVWTVDEPSHAHDLARLGVDGIFTNDPARLVTALRARARR